LIRGKLRNTVDALPEGHSEEIVLEIQHVARVAGPELNSSTPDFNLIRRELPNTMSELPDGPLEELLLELLTSGLAGTVGILCPTNEQALLVSKALWDAGVEHRVQRDATDRSLPAWIAQIFGARTGSISDSAFKEIAAEKVPAGGPSPDDAWRWLKRVTGGGRGPLDVRVVIERLRVGQVPDELVEVPRSRVTVSTIHRAKGLEYDHVLVIDPDWQVDRDADAVAEEARLAYVALTRARLDVLRWPAPPDMQGMRSGRDMQGRWMRKQPRGYPPKSLLKALEVRPIDTAVDLPIGASATGDESGAEALQDYLRSSVSVGDPVELKLLSGLESGLPEYDVRHNGTTVATTSADLGSALKRAMGFRRVTRWPSGMSEIRVEGIESFVGSSAASENAGLGRSGLWLRVRLSGLGELDWLE